MLCPWGGCSLLETPYEFVDQILFKFESTGSYGDGHLSVVVVTRSEHSRERHVHLRRRSSRLTIRIIAAGETAFHNEGVLHFS